jgi:hypothetical protein
MRVIQKLSIQYGWEGKGNHRCERGFTRVCHALAHYAVVIALILGNMPVCSANLKWTYKFHVTKCEVCSVIRFLSTMREAEIYRNIVSM